MLLLLSGFTKKLNRRVKNYATSTISTFTNHAAFSNRIKTRHDIFWRAPHSATVKNTIMSACDPIEKWQNVDNWQRKLSNKYNSREFAKMHSCKVAELYWKGRNIKSIDFNSLPANYVIRPTVGHSLQLVFLMDNSINLMDRRMYSVNDIRKVLSKAISENDKLEFLIEEFVRTEKGEYKIPVDYKFYMFNGKIGCIQVINRLSNCVGFTTWYDEKWKLLPNLTTNYPDGEIQEVPECLPQMIEFAERLSKSYEIFVRIDFYATDKGAIFGEFTPTPALGIGFTLPGDRLLADYWDKYCKGKI
jgi:hypothetical protein